MCLINMASRMKGEVVITHVNLFIDHCADLLRQKLMCDADVGLIPMYWVKHHDHPWPDFSTVHKCRNFDSVWEWASKNQMNLSEGFKLQRPADVVDLDSPP